MIKLMAAVLFLLVCRAAVAAETVTLAADLWCPYNCAQDSTRPGVLVELAAAAWSPLGVQVEYRVMPWARAKREASERKSMGLLGVGRGMDETLFLYGKVPPLVSPMCFFTLPGRHWTFSDYRSLEVIRLGVSNGYVYDGEVGKYIADFAESSTEQVQIASGVAAAEINLRKLRMGRVDVILEDRLVVRYLASISPLEPNQQPREAGCISGANDSVSIVLPRDWPHAAVLMEKLDSYIVESRRSGELDKLLKKYNLTSEHN